MDISDLVRQANKNRDASPFCFELLDFLLQHANGDSCAHGNEGNADARVFRYGRGQYGCCPEDGLRQYEFLHMHVVDEIGSLIIRYLLVCRRLHGESVEGS